jgi:hypothetical protein
VQVDTIATAAGGGDGGGGGGGFTVIMTNTSEKIFIVHLGAHAVNNMIS